MSGQIYAPATLPRHPLNMKLDRPESRFVRSGEEKNILPLPGIKPRIRCCPVCRLVAGPTKLHRLPKGAGVRGKRLRNMQRDGRQRLKEFVLSSVHRHSHAARGQSPVDHRTHPSLCRIWYRGNIHEFSFKSICSTLK
jgi:hypothetical protein